jgi:hypothetical protein
MLGAMTATVPTAGGVTDLPPGDDSDTATTEAATGGEWISRRGAMRRLGISDRTLFRWAAQGKLTTRKRGDGQLEVWIPLTEGDDTGTAMAEGETERALALVDRLGELVARQTAPLVAEVSRLARENGELQERNAQLTQRIAELEAMPVPPDSGTAMAEAAPDAPRAPWWRRLLFGQM